MLAGGAGRRRRMRAHGGLGVFRTARRPGRTGLARVVR